MRNWVVRQSSYASPATMEARAESMAEMYSVGVRSDTREEKAIGVGVGILDFEFGESKNDFTEVLYDSHSASSIPNRVDVSDSI